MTHTHGGTDHDAAISVHTDSGETDPHHGQMAGTTSIRHCVAGLPQPSAFCLL